MNNEDINIDLDAISDEEIWNRGAISFNDFYVEEKNGEQTYKVLVPKGSPLKIYLAKKYPEKTKFQITEDEVIESKDSLDDLISMLNSIGWDVTDVPHDENGKIPYDLHPNESDVLLPDDYIPGKKRALKGREANNINRDKFTRLVSYKAISFEKRKAQEEIIYEKQKIKNKKNLH